MTNTHKLLAITPTTDPGTGWGRYSKAVLRGLRARPKFDVSHTTDIGAPMQCKRLHRPKDAARLARAATRLRREIQTINADAVLSLIAHPYSTATYAATAGGRTCPYFVSCHGTYAVAPLYQPVTKSLARRALYAADRLFPVSSYTASKIREAGGPRTVTLAKNGIDTVAFGAAEPFNLDHRAIISVGPFKPRKGQAQGVEAIARIVDAHPDVEYHCIGGTGGEYHDRVRRLAQQHGIEDRVHFEGFVKEQALCRWYATADLLLFPAQYTDRHHFEGFGLVILESAQHGTPAIGTQTSGAIDAISDGYSGVLTDPTPKDLAGVLREMLADDAYREQLGQQAVEWAQGHPWEQTVDTIATEMDRKIRSLHRLKFDEHTPRRKQ